MTAAPASIDTVAAFRPWRSFRSSVARGRRGHHRDVRSHHDARKTGGERGIRTPEARFRRLHTFQACSFNHSDTSPLEPEGSFRQRSGAPILAVAGGRSEEHTSELQSLMRTSYAV